MQYDSIYDEDGPGYFDYNPVHAIWYLLTEIGIPESMINEQSFLAASITIWEEEKGISARLNTEQSTKTLIQQILAHIAGLILWGTDGKFHIVLIRNNYIVENLPVVNENVILEEPMFDRQSWPETTGEFLIQYNKRIYPPSGLRYYQEAIEVVRKGKPFIRTYEEVVEVVRKGKPFIRLYQEVIEVTGANLQACLDDITILWATSTTT